MSGTSASAASILGLGCILQLDSRFKCSYAILAREYGVSKSTIRNICKEFSDPYMKSRAIAAAEQYYLSNPRAAQPGACTTPVGSQQFQICIPNWIRVLSAAMQIWLANMELLSQQLDIYVMNRLTTSRNLIAHDQPDIISRISRT